MPSEQGLTTEDDQSELDLFAETAGITQKKYEFSLIFLWAKNYRSK